MKKFVITIITLKNNVNSIDLFVFCLLFRCSKLTYFTLQKYRVLIFLCLEKHKKLKKKETVPN